VAGSTVVNHCPPRGATSLPPMNRPYRLLSWTTSRDSGAGAYSHGIFWPSPRLHVFGWGVPRPTSGDLPPSIRARVAPALFFFVATTQGYTDAPTHASVGR